MKGCLYILFCLFLTQNLSASIDKSIDKETTYRGEDAHRVFKGAKVARYYDYTQIPAYIQFSNPAQVEEGDLENWLRFTLRLSENFRFKFIKKETDDIGYTHYRYVQTYLGYEIFGTGYLIHIRNGYVQSINGLLYHNVNIQEIKLSEKSALDLALKYVDAKVYKWDVAEEEEHAKHEFEVDKVRKSPSYFPKGELKIIPKQGDFYNSNPSFSLAYSFDIYSHEPMDRKEVFVDAHHGEIVYHNQVLKHTNSNGTAVTVFSGTKPIVTDSTSPTNFRLQETGRGNGIQTFNLNKGTNYAAATDFIDADNNWNNVNANKDQFATDVHWATEKTYDYYWQRHNRNSIDNAGFLLKSYVHNSTNFINAFWDGSRMTYGDGGVSGSCTFQPLVSIDVIGHELSHGLTEKTSNLIYSYESGALNESFSDIFGICVDYYARPSAANWIMGEEFATPSATCAIRSMSNPKAFNDPNTYLKTNWATGTADNGGVHTNSGVQNYWFYLLANGGIGKNDNLDSFWVNSIGIDTAGKIAFRNNTVYLIASSQYADARFYSIQSAIDLYGVCSKPYISTTNAWHAVGVGLRFDTTNLANFIVNNRDLCAAPQTVKFTNLSINGATYKWDFGDGNSSTLSNPSNNYLSNGSYTVSLIANYGICGIDTTTFTNYINIDSHNDCIYNTGDTNFTNACNGVIYDDGGPNGFYALNKSHTMTISPTGASSINFKFHDIDIEAGATSACGYDFVQLHNGSNIAAPSLGKFCNSNLPNSTIITSGTTATVRDSSDPFGNGRGFELRFQCQIPNSLPNVRFKASNLNSCDGIVNFTDNSYNSPTSWVWSFGDGGSSTLQNPTYIYNNTGIYNVRLIATNAFGSDTFTKYNFITVNKSQAPVISNPNQIKCAGSSFAFNATSVGTITWFDSLTSIIPIGTGANFTSPILSSSKKYYSQASFTSPSRKFAPDSNLVVSTTGGYTTTAATSRNYLLFDCIKPCRLISVKVTANSTRNRRFQLLDAQNNVIRDTILNVVSGNSNVMLGFNIPKGENLKLGIHNDSAANLYRNTAGAKFPYLDAGGCVNIKGAYSTNTSSTGAYYFYFYNWVIQENPCTSSRSLANAKVQNPILLKNLDTFNCSGSSVTLTPSGNDIDSIYWTSGASSLKSKTVNPTVTTDYIYTAFNVCGGFKDTATVSSLMIPSFSFVSNDTMVCTGQSLKLKANANIVPYWKFNGTFDSVVTVSPTITSDYIVQISNQCGNKYDTIKVTIPSSISILASNDTTICLGNSVKIKASSAYPILWYPTMVTSDSIIVNPNTSSHYIAETNNGCSSKRDTVNVNVMNPPNLIASSDTSICNGDSVRLKAITNGNITWSNTFSTDSINTVTPLSNTYYYVQATNLCGIKKDTIYISQSYKPTLTAVNDTTICNGSFKLRGYSNRPITWLPINITSDSITLNINQKNDTILKYIASANNICGTVYDTISLIVISSPKLTASNDTTICKSDSATLKAFSQNGTINWTSLGGVSSPIVKVSPLINSAFYLQSSNLCGVKKDTILVYLNVKPQIKINRDTAICLGKSVTLNQASGSSIFWSPTNVNSSVVYTVTPSINTKYIGTATNICGTVKDSILVKVVTQPTLSLSNDTSLCIGKSVNLIAYTNDSFSWIMPLIDTHKILNLFPITSSIYTARAANICGEFFASLNLNVLNKPKAIASKSITNRIVKYSNTSTNSTSYLWKFGNGVTSNIKSPTYTYTASGTYNVVLIATNSCYSDTLYMTINLYGAGISSSSSKMIKVYPNPSSDIINIEFSELNSNQYSEIKLYDINGRMVLNESIHSNIHQVNISHLASGQYELIIKNSDFESREKIMIEK